MQRQHDDHGPRLFDQFEAGFEDGFDDEHRSDDPETSEFWGGLPTGRLDRLRDARHRARSQRRSADHPTSVPTAPEVVQRLQEAGRHVDPLLQRAGILLTVIALLVPIAMAFRGGDDSPTIAAADAALAVETAVTVTTIKWYEPLPTKAPGSDTTRPRRSSTTAPATTPATEAPKPAPATTTATTPQVAIAAVECTSKYTVVAGDSWIGIARKVQVTLDQVLAANNATKRTMLWPRQKICLPPNASPPTTARPTPTTVKPTTTTTSRPSTTVPRVNYTRAQVEQIIRSIWPDHLETKALAIAVRESNLNPYSQNFCCSGLFQIYFNVHRGWLAGIGVTSAAQLYDPKVSAYAALVLYQRNGWAPWE